MTQRLRDLTERRVVILLRQGGVIVPVRGARRVHRGRDTRSQAAGWISPHIVDRLAARGQLRPQPDFPDRLEGTRLPVPEVNGALVRHGRPAGGSDGRRREDLLARTLKGRQAKGTAIRLSAAAGRFRDDFQRAARPDPNRLRPVFGWGGVLPPERMRALEAEIGTPAMRHLEDLIIDRVSPAVAAACWQAGEAEAGEVARSALLRLAEAYDLSPSADSPARASERIRSSIEASPFER